eukprot:1223355-Rhodomonas_salina.1
MAQEGGHAAVREVLREWGESGAGRDGESEGAEEEEGGREGERGGGAKARASPPLGPEEGGGCVPAAAVACASACTKEGAQVRPEPE